MKQHTLKIKIKVQICLYNVRLLPSTTFGLNSSKVIQNKDSRREQNNLIMVFKGQIKGAITFVRTNNGPTLS